jgi:hypothetical protein
MMLRYKVLLSCFMFFHGLSLFGQEIKNRDDSLSLNSKSKKLIYIENYIEKYGDDKEMLEFYKRIELWGYYGTCSCDMSSYG